MTGAMSGAAKRVCWAVLGGILLAGQGFAATAEPPAGKEAIFARVGDTVITRKNYDDAFLVAVRNTFYHPNPGADKLAALQRKVGEQLVNNALLLQEAKRRGLKPDETQVKKDVAAFDKRYAGNEKWRQNRARFLPELTADMEKKSLLEQVERQVRNVPEPSEKQLKAYYLSHPKLFTEPEQVRVSLILLKVDPSAPNSAREKATKEAEEIIKRLRKGADFAAEAKAHSGDSTAAQGGDMGYLHQGMLGRLAESAIAKLKPGEISPPVGLLEGVAIFRLEQRRPARLDSFAESRKRARDLWRREQSDLAWKGLIAKLRKQTPILMDTSFYRPLAGGGHDTDAR